MKTKKGETKTAGERRACPVCRGGRYLVVQDTALGRGGHHMTKLGSTHLVACYACDGRQQPRR